MIASPASVASESNASDRLTIVLSQAFSKQTTPAINREHCEPAYPDFCLQTVDRDLDCDDIPEHRNFQVLPPDPYKFDRDKDGTGCESK